MIKFLKEKKSIIISFIIGTILASSITVYATGYLAREIEYNIEGKTNVNNVEDALNDLYNQKSDIDQTDAVATDIAKNKKAYTKEGLIIGQKEDPTYKERGAYYVWVGHCTFAKVVKEDGTAPSGYSASGTITGNAIRINYNINGGVSIYAVKKARFRYSTGGGNISEKEVNAGELILSDSSSVASGFVEEMF